MISGKYGRRALLFGIGTTAGALALGSRIWDDATAFPPSSTSSAPTASGSPSPAPDDPFRPVYHYTPPPTLNLFAILAPYMRALL